ncbi:MAG: hypothetical protein ABW221_20515 [Vicinamibacteria bacterium]
MPLDASSLAARRFRAGSLFDLVVFDRLPHAEQAPLAELRADPDFYGVLRPRPGSGRTVKVAGRDVALLFLTLGTPGPLPFFVWGEDPEDAAREVLDLVLDGVLEMEEEGAFVCGSAALRLAAPGASGPSGRIGRLSQEALRHVEALALDDPNEIAGRLYGYGRLPVSPDWERRLPDAAAVLAFVGAAPGGPVARQLEAGWDRGPAGKSPGWIAWSPRAAHDRAGGRAVHKLYVSPQPESLPQAFAALVDVLARRGHRPFKVGDAAPGVLRPDKLVAYFADVEELQAAAQELAERLPGLAAHGVPFSAEAGGDGLLSWGMDPPASERAVAWQEPESWRLWLARRLAAALLAARRDGSDLPPHRFAVERLRREGVDVDRWTPGAAMWRVA